MPYGLVPQQLNELGRTFRGIAQDDSRHRLSMEELGLRQDAQRQTIAKEKYNQFMNTTMPVETMIQNLPGATPEQKQKIANYPPIKLLIDKQATDPEFPVFPPAKLWEAANKVRDERRAAEEADLKYKRETMASGVEHLRAKELQEEKYKLEGGLARTKADVKGPEEFKVPKWVESEYEILTKESLDIEAQLSGGDEMGQPLPKGKVDALTQRYNAIEERRGQLRQQMTGSGNKVATTQANTPEEAMANLSPADKEFFKSKAQQGIPVTWNPETKAFEVQEKPGAAAQPQGETGLGLNRPVAEPQKSIGSQLSDYTDIMIDKQGTIWGKLNGQPTRIMAKPKETETYYGKTRPSSEYAKYVDLLRRLGKTGPQGR